MVDGSGSGRPYLVAYERDQGNHRDIYGRVLRDTSLVTPITNLTDLLGPSSGFLDQFQPSIDSDGSTFVLANTQQEPGGSQFDVTVGTMTLASNQLLRAEQILIWAGESGRNESTASIYASRSNDGPTGRVYGVWDLGSDIQGGRYQSPGPGDVYCTSFPHSGGVRARLASSGSISIFENSLTLIVSAAPPNKTGMFYLGPNQVSIPFGEGRRCVGGGVRRILPVDTTDTQGAAVRALDFNAGYGWGIFAGSPGVNPDVAITRRRTSSPPTCGAS